MSKNICKILLILLIGFTIIDCVPVYADNNNYQYSQTNNDVSDFTCQNYNIRNAVQIVSTSLLWIRVLVPVLLVIKSMISFGKAVVSQNDDDIKNAVNDLLRKIAVGALIFFIPLLIITMLKGITAYTTLMSDWADCIQLLR